MTDLSTRTYASIAAGSSGDTWTAPDRVSSTDGGYAALMRQVRGQALLDRSVVGYLPRMIVLATLMGMCVAGFVLLGRSWWQLATAAAAALLFAQIGFLAHDAGHQQIFRVRRHNDLLGRVLADLLVGLGYDWWVGKHRRHHQRPNDVAVDPDVQRGVVAWTPAQARAHGGLLGAVVAHQDVWFVPLLTFEAWNLHVSSVRSALSHKTRSPVDAVLLLVHATVYGGVLFWFLSPWQAIAFIVVHQALLGLYLGGSFAPNHKGMLMPDAQQNLDFLRRQVLTSRNVRGRWLLTAALGALNYQIEHHLFPSMPSHKLRRCQPFVRDFCAAHGVDYREAGLIASYSQALRSLRAAGRAASPTQPVVTASPPWG